MTRQKTIIIFGGTGFIGRHIVKHLAAQGHIIKVATRIPESAYFLKPDGDVGQIVPITYDMHDYDSIATATADCNIIINCIGILYERKKQHSNAFMPI